MQNLPIDIIHHIFDYLPLETLLNKFNNTQYIKQYIITHYKKDFNNNNIKKISNKKLQLLNKIILYFDDINIISDNVYSVVELINNYNNIVKYFVNKYRLKNNNNNIKELLKLSIKKTFLIFYYIDELFNNIKRKNEIICDVIIEGEISNSCFLGFIIENYKNISNKQLQKILTIKYYFQNLLIMKQYDLLEKLETKVNINFNVLFKIYIKTSNNSYSDIVTAFDFIQYKLNIIFTFDIFNNNIHDLFINELNEQEKNKKNILRYFYERYPEYFEKIKSNILTFNLNNNFNLLLFFKELGINFNEEIETLVKNDLITIPNFNNLANNGFINRDVKYCKYYAKKGQNRFVKDLIAIGFPSI